MATRLFSFEYRFNLSDGSQSLWSMPPRVWKTRRGAELAAERERETYAGLNSDIEARVVELVSDGRNGRVPETVSA